MQNALQSPTQSPHPQPREAEASISEADAQPLSAPKVRPPHGRNIRRRLLLMGGVIALLVLGGAVAFVRFMAPPSDLDYSTERVTPNQIFRVAYTPSIAPPPINQLHTWKIRVTTPDGQPIEGAKITVDGDMPQHGHGLPTRPQVTRSLGDGTYLVEGMKFQMGGWWVMDFTIDANGQSDMVRFNMAL
jgi:hypothetical protein